LDPDPSTNELSSELDEDDERESLNNFNDPDPYFERCYSYILWTFHKSYGFSSVLSIFYFLTAPPDSD